MSTSTAQPKKPGPGRSYRIGVAVRALAAILGGYALSASWAAALALMLPAVRVEAALTATMTALAIYPCAAMWCFAARSAPRAVIGLAVAGIVPAIVLLTKGGA